MAMTRTPILNRTLIERYKALIRYIFLSIVKFIFREPLANSRHQKFWLLVCSEISCVWGTLVDGERFKIRASAWLSEGGGPPAGRTNNDEKFRELAGDPRHFATCDIKRDTHTHYDHLVSWEHVTLKRHSGIFNKACKSEKTSKHDND